jgi:hypothetical protein
MMKRIVVLTILGLFFVASVALCDDNSVVTRIRNTVGSSTTGRDQGTRITAMQDGSSYGIKLFAVKIKAVTSQKRLPVPASDGLGLKHFAVKIQKNSEISFLKVNKDEEPLKVKHFAVRTAH